MGRLIARYDQLAAELCASFRATGMEREDLLQEAYLGLLKAIHSYRPEKGVPFSAFAGLCMKRQLVSAVRRQTAKKNQPLNDSVPLEETAFSSFPSQWQQDGPEAAVILQEESRRVREQVAFMEEDRELWPDIRAVEALVRSGELLALAEQVVPDLA